MRRRSISAVFLIATLPWPVAAAAAGYSATRVTIDGVAVIRLEDTARHTVVSTVPSIGNIAFEMKVNGHDLLRFPFPSVGEFKKNPRMCGIPLLAPWADRLDENAFYANGRKFSFDPSLGNVQRDEAGYPIHGFLTLAPDWTVTALAADAKGARVTSRLDVSRRPEWMAQFPFAHAIEMTYSLADGVLEVRTRVENKSAEAMPLSIGYHSFFQIADAPRDEWRVGLGATREWPVNQQLLPTGATRPLTELIANPADFPLRGRGFDNGFTDMIRDGNGRASFWVKGKRQKIEVLFGPRYIAGEIYAPAGRDFICFEPMAAINNGLNLAHRGQYKELQTIPADESWQESFWIRPSGY